MDFVGALLNVIKQTLIISLIFFLFSKCFNYKPFYVHKGFGILVIPLVQYLQARLEPTGVAPLMLLHGQTSAKRTKPGPSFQL
jgi:hypothetical protein